MANLIPLNVSTRMIRRALAEENLRSEFSSLLKTELVKGGQVFRTKVVEHIGRETELTVLEFGVFEGKSMRFWSDNFVHPQCKFDGFDSFEGLPENWTPNLKKGAFSTEGKAPQISDDRVNFHTGWIQNTLPGFLRDMPTPAKNTTLIHIDVDIYSATLFTLSMIWPHFDEFYVVFDEFEMDENRALADFASCFPVSIDWYLHTMAGNGLPGKAFCKLKKVPYSNAAG